MMMGRQLLLIKYSGSQGDQQVKFITSNTTPLTASIDTPPSQPSDREYYYTTNPHMLQIGGG